MKMHLRCSAVVLLLAACSAHAASIAIDTAVTYQAIDGFGGFGPQAFWWANESIAFNGMYYTDSWVEEIITDLGVTIIRDEAHPDIETSNDNDDPNVIDWNALDMSTYPGKPDKVGLNFEGHIPFIRKAHQVARENNEPLKYITSIWSPPAWMKTNNSTSEGGSLIDTDAMREELAEFCEIYVKAFKEKTGVDLYAFSIQNELAFREPYNSCVYTPEQFRKALTAVGRRFDREGFPTRIYGAETMGTYTRSDGVRNYFEPILQDEEAQRHIDILAVHGYRDGVQPDYGDAPGWGAIYELAAKPLGIPLWLTETGCKTGYDGGLETAMGIHLALKHGNLAAWVFWYTTDELYQDGTMTKRPGYYMAKQYFRYVRPGAIRIDAETQDNEILVTAYTHSANDCMTIVAINRGSSSKSVTLSGTGLPAAFKLFQTSQSDNCADKGEVGSDQAISLPPRSITTLVSGRYEGSGTAVAKPSRAHGIGRSTQGRGYAALYDPRGRLIDREPADALLRHAAHGLYVRAGYDSHGNPVCVRSLSVGQPSRMSR